jgi:hypothetical protein
MTLFLPWGEDSAVGKALEKKNPQNSPLAFRGLFFDSISHSKNLKLTPTDHPYNKTTKPELCQELFLQEGKVSKATPLTYVFTILYEALPILSLLECIGNSTHPSLVFPPGVNPHIV